MVTVIGVIETSLKYSICRVLCLLPLSAGGLVRLVEVCVWFSPVNRSPWAVTSEFIRNIVFEYFS